MLFHEFPCLLLDIKVYKGNLFLDCMIIDLLRHGPKNNDPEAHQTGVEALLDPEKFYVIKDHARRVIKITPDNYEIQIITTPIPRSIATGQLEYEVIKRSRQETPEPKINALIGSSGCHPETGDAVNLVPRSMSKIWTDAKKLESYQGQQGENKPLYAWFEQGLDNRQSWLSDKPETWNPQDPGISLREIAWRIGAFFYETLTSYDERTRVMAFGHSGDIEPWLALTLQMYAGKDDGVSGTTIESMKEIFTQIGGALEPLSGVTLDNSWDSEIYLRLTTKSQISIDTNILEEQSRLFRNHGLSNKVLMARLALNPKK